MKTKIILNSDTDLVNAIRQALSANNGYCPCQLIKSADTKCMCKDFKNQKEGMCHCGLYIKIKQEEQIDAKKMEK